MVEESANLWQQWEAYFQDLFSPETFLGMGSAALKVLFIVIVSYIILKVSNRIIDTGFAMRKLPGQKQDTLSKLLKSVMRYAVYFIAGLTILKNVGFDPMPVLAGAGVAGLAIGFGAQNLIRDIISGFFIIFENQFAVGDYVRINNAFEGTVEEMGLRISKIREWNGRLHHIANGEITQITNYNRKVMRPLVDIRVPYEENMQTVFQKLEDVCQSIGEKYARDLIEKPSVFGITDIENGGVQFTIMALSVPEQYWFIERQMRLAIIETFQDDDIEIAYPRRVLIDGKSMYSRRMTDH